MLDGGRQGFARVDSLGGRQTDQFGPRKGEGSRDENGAEPLEAIVEGAGVGPVAATNIAVVGEAANIDDDPEEAGKARSEEVVSESREGHAYMKPTTAVILAMAKTNSASP